MFVHFQMYVIFFDPMSDKWDSPFWQLSRQLTYCMKLVLWAMSHEIKCYAALFHLWLIPSIFPFWQSWFFRPFTKFHALHCSLRHIPISKETKKQNTKEETLMSCSESSSWMQDNQHREQDTRATIQTFILSILLTGRQLLQSINFTMRMSPISAYPELQTDCTPGNSPLLGTAPSEVTDSMLN